MAGIDAESIDLTARIQARRRALVLSGEVEPLLPGERMIHGRSPGAHDAFETTGAAQAHVAAARARRANADQVVEMDYTDYRNAAVSEDADRPFDVDDDNREVDEDEPVDTAELVEAERFVEHLVIGENDVVLLDLRVAGVEAALQELAVGLDDKLSGLGDGFLALAKGLSEELASIRTLLVEASRAEEPVQPPRRRFLFF